MREKVGIDPAGMTTEEKMAALRRTARTNTRSCTMQSTSAAAGTTTAFPTVAKLKELGIDFPDVVALVQANS